MLQLLKVDLTNLAENHESPFNKNSTHPHPQNVPHPKARDYMDFREIFM